MNLIPGNMGNGLLNAIGQTVFGNTPAGSMTLDMDQQDFFATFSKELDKFNSFQNLNIPPGKAAMQFPGMKPLLRQLPGLGKVAYPAGAVEDSARQEILKALSVSGVKLSDLNGVSIDAEGLGILEQVLLNAGYPKEDVSELISGFLEKVETQTVTLDEVMDSLLELESKGEQDMESPENLLGSSSLPFIETILYAFQIPEEQVRTIVSSIDRGEEGGSLDTLLEQLKTIEKESVRGGRVFTTFQESDSFFRLFGQLGLEVPERQASQPTLSDFISALETLKKDLSSLNAGADDQKSQALSSNLPAGSGKSSQELLSALMDHLNVREGKTASEVVISQGQVQNPLKTGMALSGDQGVKDLFVSENRSSGADAVAPVSSAVQALLNETSGSRAESFGRDGNPFGRKVASAVDGDSSSLSDVGIGPGEKKTDQSLNILKPGAGLRNLPNYVTRQVSRSMLRAVRQGEETLTLQLKPAELGRIMMTIDHGDNSMKVSILTENAAARDILASNVNDVRTLLSGSGISLESFEVDMNSDFRQSMADARQQSGNSGKKNRDRKGVAADPVDGKNINDSAGTLVSDQGGSLHTIA